MFAHLRISDWRERWLVGAADAALRVLSPTVSLLSSSRQVPDPPERILLLRLERVGDLLMALQAIRTVRRFAPAARIDIVVGSWNAGLASVIEGVDHVETLNVPWMARDDDGASWLTLTRRALSWRERQYDLGINIEGDIRSNALLALSGATRRVGFEMGGGGPLLTETVTFSDGVHIADNLQRLVSTAFASYEAAVDPSPGVLDLACRLPIPDESARRAESLLADAGASGALIGIQGGAGREIKQWDPVRFAEVGSMLAREYDATLVLTGTKDERRVTDQLMSVLPPDVRVVDLATDLDLLALAAILNRLDLFISCDTGPMHLAAAVGTPIVAIFGPSLPSRYAPLSARSRIVRVDLPCSPCNQLRRPPKRCVGHVPDCLVGVEVRQVLDAARQVLAASPSGARQH